MPNGNRPTIRAARTTPVAPTAPRPRKPKRARPVGGVASDPEAGRAPAAPPLGHEVPGPIGERGQLADDRDGLGEQVAAAEQQHQCGHPDDDHVLLGEPAPHRADQLAPALGQRGGLVAGPGHLAPHEGTEPGAAPHLHAPYLQVAHPTGPSDLAPLGHQRTQGPYVPGVGGEELPGVPEAPAEGGHHDLDQRQQHLTGDDGDGVEAAVVAEHHPQPVAGLQPASVVGAALAQGLHVAGPGRRRHQHPGTRQVGAPAQVDVLAVVGHRLVEATQRGEQVGADQHAAPGHGEDVAHAVVLFLVELAPLGDGARAPRTGPSPPRRAAAERYRSRS